MRGQLIRDMITNQAGAVSSKIIIGSLTYIAIVAAVITLCFTKPDFTGLSDIVVMLIISSSSLLGLTTVENIAHTKKRKKEGEEFEEDNDI